MEKQQIQERAHEGRKNSLLPSGESYQFTLQGIPFLRRIDDIPAQLGLFWAALQVLKYGRPKWPPLLRWPMAMIFYILLQIAETLHSVGHITSAEAVNAPVNAVINTTGRQLTVYYDNNVTPTQHIGRAAGGPLMSAFQTGISYLLWRWFRRVPLLGTLFEMWFICNGAVLAISMMPTPTFDGGTLLRWGVALQTGDESLGDEAVQQAGFAAAAGVMLAGLVFLLRGKLPMAAGCAGVSIYMVADLLFLRGGAK